MSKQRLGDFVKIKTGKLDANAASKDGVYPFFTCAKEPLAIDSYSYDCECVLVAGNGDLNVKYYKGKFDAYQRTYIIESIDPSVLSTKYLFRFLDYHIETLRSQSIGGVIKYIKLGNLTDARISIPSLSKQLDISDTLTRCDLIRHNLNQITRAFDCLIKSRFIEMFGDPNEIKDYSKFDEAFIVRDDVRRPLSSSQRDQMRNGSLYPYYGANGEVDRINEYLSDFDALCLAEDCGSYGREQRSSYIIRGKAWVNNHAHVLIPTNRCNLEYANEYFYLLDISKRISGTTREKLTKFQMLKLPVFLPPIEEQIEFAQFVNRINKLRFDTQEQIRNLEIVKQSLMQKYFG